MKTYVSSWQCLAELFLGWKHFRVKVAEIVKTSRLCLQGLAWNFIFTIFDKTFWAFVKHLDPVCRDWREILYLRFLTKIFLAFVKTSRLCLQGLAWNFIFTIFDKIFLAFVKTSRLCLEGLAWNFIFTIFDKNFFDTFRFCLKYGKHKTLYLNAYVDFNIWPILDFIILAVFCAVRTEVQETVF